MPTGSNIYSQTRNDTWHLTLFKNRAAREKHELIVTDQEFEDELLHRRAPKKEHLPWIKAAAFGNKRTKNQCLRNNNNVIGIYGIEVDYDGEEMPVSEAVAKARQAGLRAIIVTSPSHTAEKPRWRIYLRTSRRLPPEARGKLVSRVNGVLGGVLAAESWTLSQAFYMGGVEGNPDHQVVRVGGERYIDEATELDDGAIGKPETKPSNDNGDSPEGDGRLDVDALLEAIRTGANYHLATLRLVGRWIYEGVPQSDAETRMRAAFEEVAEVDRDERWQKRYADIGRIVADLFEKDARERAEAEDEAETIDRETIPSWADWVSRAIPPPDYLLGEWMSTTSRIAISAVTGLGKTWFALEIAFAVAVGGDFLCWKGGGIPRRVLFVDGEMSRGQMQQRVWAITQRYGGLIPEGLFILSREDFDDMPPLNTKEGQKYFDHLITMNGGHFDLIIFDNKQSLLDDDDNYGKKTWHATTAWVRNFTRDLTAQIWVHHVGHDGRPYGTITFTWQMETSVIMTECSVPPDKDIAFKFKFQKARGRSRENKSDFAPMIVTLGEDQWDWEPITSGQSRFNNGAHNSPDARQRAIELLNMLIKQEGEVPPAAEGIPPEILCVMSKSWRQMYIDDEFGRGVRTETAERTWRRAKEQLLKQERIGECGDWVWFIK